MQYQIPRYLNEQVRFIGLQSDEFFIVLLSIYFCAIFRFQWIVLFLNIAMVIVYLVEPQFSQGFYPAFSIFQRIL